MHVLSSGVKSSKTVFVYIAENRVLYRCKFRSSTHRDFHVLLAPILLFSPRTNYFSVEP